jgi:hypothetical protein
MEFRETNGMMVPWLESDMATIAVDCEEMAGDGALQGIVAGLADKRARSSNDSNLSL